jgi:hypothetical protein
MAVLSFIPAILQEFFILNVPIQLLICKHYSKALLPFSIIYHVIRILKLSKDVREAVAEVAAQLPPYTLDTIPLPANYSKPIPELPIYEAFKCRQCNFIQRSHKETLRHVAKVYGRTSKPVDETDKVEVQTWFADNRARF